MSLFNTPFDSLLISGGGGNDDVPVEAHYILSPANMYTDRAGTINVTVQDDFVGNISDSSGNANTLVAPTDAARALAKTDGTNWWIQLDKVDDNYSTTFADPITGTMLIGTRKGTIQIEVDIPAGPWSLTPNPTYFPGDTITDIIIYDGVLTDAQVENVLTWFEGRGSPRVYTPGATDLVDGFREWPVTSVVLNADMTNATSFLRTYNAAKITEIDSSAFALSQNVIDFRFTFFLTPVVTIPPGLLDSQTVCINYQGFLVGCALTQESLYNILQSLQVSVTANNLNTGLFEAQSGTNATPDAATQLIIDDLRINYGWTINVNGYPA